MTCESTQFGLPCRNEAKWFVSGPCVTRHATCDRCKWSWGRFDGPGNVLTYEPIPEAPMIGKVKITSGGYDPDDPRTHYDPTLDPPVVAKAKALRPRQRAFLLAILRNEPLIRFRHVSLTINALIGRGLVRVGPPDYTAAELTDEGRKVARVLSAMEGKPV